MPLEKSSSKGAFVRNLKAEIHAGKPQKVALAIAYAVKRRKRAEGGGLTEVDEAPVIDTAPEADVQQGTFDPRSVRESLQRATAGDPQKVLGAVLKYPGHVLEGLATLPKRAIEGAGQYRPGSGEMPDEAIAPTLETALTMVGGAGLAPVEANALRTGIGISSKGSHLKKLAQFERLENKGTSPEMNYSVTGWYRGGDEKPRYWLQDKDAKLTDKVQQLPDGMVGMPSMSWREGPQKYDAVRLGDLWDHPRLYDAYPWLKDVPVKESNAGGFYDPVNKSIHVRAVSTPAQLQDVLHHEAVHAIQHREGFGWGGGHEQFVPENIKRAEPHLEEAKKSFDAKVQQETGWNPFSARMVATMRPEAMNAEQLSMFNTMKDKGLLDQLKQIHQYAQQLQKAKDESYARYLHLHGESEARDAPYLRNNPDTLQAGRIPLHVNPDLTPGRQIEVVPAPHWVGSNKKNRAKGGPVNKALNIAYEAKRQARADGGGVFEGPIISDVPGRTDKHPMDVAAGSYVIPSETVSHLGENNTLAGMKNLKQLGPHGIRKMVMSVHGASEIARKHRLKRAIGGVASDEQETGHPVPVITAGGEHVLSPEEVRIIGGGDVSLGHRLLDNWIVQNRRNHVKTLQKLSPPAQD
jgi:hypothetical protein